LIDLRKIGEGRKLLKERGREDRTGGEMTGITGGKKGEGVDIA